MDATYGQCTVNEFLCSCGMALSVGIYYPEWLRVFNASHTATAWIGSVNTGLLFAGGTCNINAKSDMHANF